jgi:pimeloyl-ACP methyl ester carboxylesterase
MVIRTWATSTGFISRRDRFFRSRPVHDVFCADLLADDAAFMAISQRPVAAAAFDDPVTASAWHAKPSWAVFGTADFPVAPELHRFSYDRAGSPVTEVESASHFVMMSQPDIVAGSFARQ